MSTSTVQHPASSSLPLDRFGPERCESMDEPTARRWCAALARRRYENFPVLSALVPPRLREDFAAVYAFCRWADDLGDESGTPARAAELLAWWRGELDRCMEGSPRHPVFVALRPAIERHALPRAPFDDLISAFEMDQRVDRYGTWKELLGYCRLSADPVGRLVLMLFGEARTPELFEPSDRICTALQLVNHWQDIRRDRLERNRVYVPREMNPIADFEERLERTVRLGHAPDRTFFAESRQLVRALVERTWPLFDEGRVLLDRIGPEARPVVRLFVEGGEHVLGSIAAWNFETVLHRPRLPRIVKAWLVGRAWLGAKATKIFPGRRTRTARRAAPRPEEAR